MPLRPVLKITSLEADRRDGFLVIRYVRNDGYSDTLKIREAIDDMNGLIAMFERSESLPRGVTKLPDMKKVKEYSLSDKVRRRTDESITNLHWVYVLKMVMLYFQKEFATGDLKKDDANLVRFANAFAEDYEHDDQEQDSES